MEQRELAEEYAKRRGKRRVWIAVSACALLGLQVALLCAARSVRHRAGWQLPQAHYGYYELRLSHDGSRLRCYFWDKRTENTTLYRDLDTRTGDVLAEGVGKTNHNASSENFIEARFVVSQTGARVFLPDDSAPSHWLRLEKLHAPAFDLRALPRFDVFTLKDVRFAPNNQLLVLSRTRFWRVNAATGQILSTTAPIGSHSRNWSPHDENCTLSADGSQILTLAPRPTLYSTQTGHKIRSFGQPMETECGGCGCASEPDTGLSPDGHLA